jgi:hypothetical protein
MKGRGVTLVLLLLVAATACAWDSETHEWLARELCEDTGCNQSCSMEMQRGSVAPDEVFHDHRDHHLYSTARDCPESELWNCPEKDDFIALEKMHEWLERGSCYSVGVASHYFFDSKVFWHRVQNEDYFECHKPFEDRVGEVIEREGFNVTQCGVSVTKNDFMLWLLEFEVKLGMEERELQRSEVEVNDAGIPWPVLVGAALFSLCAAKLLNMRKPPR